MFNLLPRYISSTRCRSSSIEGYLRSSSVSRFCLVFSFPSCICRVCRPPRCYSGTSGEKPAKFMRQTSRASEGFPLELSLPPSSVCGVSCRRILQNVLQRLRMPERSRRAATLTRHLVAVCRRRRRLSSCLPTTNSSLRALDAGDQPDLRPIPVQCAAKRIASWRMSLSICGNVLRYVCDRHQPGSTRVVRW